MHLKYALKLVYENTSVPRTQQPKPYRSVQGLARGLAVLEVMNAHSGARASVADLSRETGLHRTTVKRLLETLRHVGYVRYTAESNSYCLAFRVRRLSENFRDESWIVDVAVPLMRKLTAKILWPSDLVTPEEDELVVRDTTHPLSPLSFSTGAFGTHMPILRSAVGRAYLAFCPEEERQVLLKMLRERGDEQGDRARDVRYVRRLVESTRTRGYSVNERGEGVGQGRFGAIAMPIRLDGRVLGCLNIVFLLRAVSCRQIVELFLLDLQATVVQIEAGITRLQRERESGGQPQKAKVRRAYALSVKASAAVHAARSNIGMARTRSK